jgi:Homeodomain-like domain
MLTGRGGWRWVKVNAKSKTNKNASCATSAEERARLDELIRKGKRSAQLLTKARILLKADVSEIGEGWSDSRIAAALDTSIATIERTRRQPGVNVSDAASYSKTAHPSPFAAVRKPLAVLHHEVDVMLGARHRRCGERLHHFRVPMDLRQLGAVGERLTVAGNAGRVGVDHHGISEDRSKQGSIVTDGDNLPSLVSPELRECEPIRHLQSVLGLWWRMTAAAPQMATTNIEPDNLSRMMVSFCRAACFCHRIPA